MIGITNARTSAKSGAKRREDRKRGGGGRVALRCKKTGSAMADDNISLSCLSAWSLPPAGRRTLPCPPPALPCVALHVICIETSRRGGTVGSAGQRPMATRRWQERERRRRNPLPDEDEGSPQDPEESGEGRGGPGPLLFYRPRAFGPLPPRLLVVTTESRKREDPRAKRMRAMSTGLIGEMASYVSQN